MGPLTYIAANQNVAVFPSVSLRAVATYTSDDIQNPGGRALVCVVDITAGAGAVVVTIKGKDANGVLYTILASSSLSGVSTTVLRVDDALTAAANTIAKDIVPSTVVVTAAVSSATLTFSVGMSIVA